MPRAAKRVDTTTVEAVINYVKNQERKFFMLNCGLYSVEYINALKGSTLSNMLNSALGAVSKYLREEQKEEAVNTTQLFIDSYMSSDDRTRMWKAIRKTKHRKRIMFGLDSFQLSFDGISNDEFKNLKGEIENRLKSINEDVTASDLIISLMKLAASSEDSDFIDALESTIVATRKKRKSNVYKNSELFQRREQACLDALMEKGLSENDGYIFMMTVELDDFSGRTINTLLEEKEDKAVPEYLQKLVSLKLPAKGSDQRKDWRGRTIGGIYTYSRKLDDWLA